MVERVTVAHGGEMTSQQMPTSKETRSSTEYQSQGGFEVRQGPLGFKANVSDPSLMNDNDLVVIDGMELKVRHAREMGLLSKTPEELDGGLSVGTAAKAAEEARQAEAQEPETQKTGNETYDDAVDGLNVSLDAGIMAMDEAQTYDGIAAEVAFSGLNFADAFETVEGLASGEVAEADVPGDVRSMLKDAEAKIAKAAVTSAQAELGSDFAWLDSAAKAHPWVDRVVRQYAADRAMGRAGDVSWTDLAAAIREQLGG